MKEMIDKLSAGILSYEEPKISVDTEKIQIRMHAEEQKEGSFFVENVGSGKLKGIVYSDNPHIRIKTKTFGNMRTAIRFQADTENLKGKTGITGELCLVSNGGEVYLPFEIQILDEAVNTSIGEIRNIFQFADLAQKEYGEALKLFQSRRFPEIILRGEDGLKAGYEALMKGSNKQIAMDQFLIAANKKKAVCLSLDEKEKYYENITEDIQDVLALKKENWGYIGGRIQADGAFLKVEKETLESEDFQGNLCSLPYRIVEKRLHEGYNYGWIRIFYQQNCLEVKLKIYKQHEDGRKLTDGRIYGYKKNLAKLYHCYLDFRMRKKTRQQWAEESLKYVTEIRKFLGESMFFSLCQIMIMMSQGKEIESKLMFEEITKKMDASFEKDPLEYCFYLYIRALRKKNTQSTEKSLETIRHYYENGFEKWQLLWMILYLDDNYMRNDSLKLLRMKEQYDLGMRSPLMYYESMAVLNETPSFLRVLDDYERAVISFGMRYHFVDKKVIWRVLELCGTDKSFKKENYELLRQAYEMTESEKILTEIVSTLIKGCKTEEKYFYWYDLGVRKGLKLTGLYEYYMYTMSYEYRGEIPEVIYMYFVYNLNLKGEKLDFLYQKMIENKEQLPKIYKVYESIIERYARECVRLGRMNDKLAVIYEEMIPKMIEKGEYSDKLPEIFQTYLIQCENPDIREVMVIYREVDLEEHVPFISGRAYVHIYSGNAVMVFGDVEGNRYLQSVAYQKKKLMNMERYLPLCHEHQPEHLGLLLYLNDGYAYQKYLEDAPQVMQQLLKIADIRKDYRAFLEMQLLEYRAEHSTVSDWEEYFKNLDMAELSPGVRGKMIELAVERGLEPQAYEMLTLYGSMDISDRVLFRIVDRKLQETEEKFDEKLCSFALESYRRGKYNERILGYLGKYFYGSTKEMYALWNSICNFQYESRELEEKLVVQILFTGEYGNRIGEIFDSYLKHGADEKVKKAYLNKKSYEYFVLDNSIDSRIITQIEGELFRNEQVYYLAQLAWLKYQAGLRETGEKEQEKCRELIQKLCESGKIFEFYKKFQKYFPLPKEIENKTILEYHTIPYSEVFLYLFEDGNMEYRQYKMQHAGHGIFIYPLVLFYGEKKKYYIKEKREGEEKVTESMEIGLSREHSWSEESVYGMINDALICMEMGEDQTLVELAENYSDRKALNQRMLEV